MIYLMFYLVLALLMGTLFDSTGPVIAIPIAVLIGMSLRAIQVQTASLCAIIVSGKNL
jgi:hypothetical protein